MPRNYSSANGTVVPTSGDHPDGYPEGSLLSKEQPETWHANTIIMVSNIRTIFSKLFSSDIVLRSLAFQLVAAAVLHQRGARKRVSQLLCPIAACASL